ncbi:hypothetical protein MMC17_007561 [Xylographa soralifera]|nr:hypothetical protein [Xylographa soralifera]
MDLVAGVRKEGSRGGRGDFKWEDVKDNQHRENYLGHSLMAPVGRWQKNKDLGWYAKGDGSLEAAETAARERREEIARIKEAERDALREALGYAVEKRGGVGIGTGANAMVVVAEEEGGLGMGIGPGMDMNERIGGEDGMGVEKRKGDGGRRDKRREDEHRHRGSGPRDERPRGTEKPPRRRRHRSRSRSRSRSYERQRDAPSSNPHGRSGKRHSRSRSRDRRAMTTRDLHHCSAFVRDVTRRDVNGVGIVTDCL